METGSKSQNISLDFLHVLGSAWLHHGNKSFLQNFNSVTSLREKLEVMKGITTKTVQKEYTNTNQSQNYHERKRERRQRETDCLRHHNKASYMYLDNMICTPFALLKA